MPQLQNLVLTDRTTPTAVNHTFTPESLGGGVATVVEGSGVKIGENRLTIATRREKSTGNYKVELELNVPTVVTETINGVSTPKVARRAYGLSRFTFAPDSTEAERNNVVGMMASALAPEKVLVNGALVKLEGVY